MNKTGTVFIGTAQVLSALSSVEISHIKATVGKATKVRQRYHMNQIQQEYVQHVDRSHQGNSGTHQPLADNRLCNISQYFKTVL